MPVRAFLIQTACHQHLVGRSFRFNARQAFLDQTREAVEMVERGAELPMPVRAFLDSDLTQNFWNVTSGEFQCLSGIS